ncbi:MAG: hypothetical protein IJ111_13650 [Eggerthellaceae bacterium]|nr:hypothetical protein [Eggerthellaceae bacterium]
MSYAPDYCDVIAAAIEAAGYPDVMRKLPDDCRRMEAVMVFPADVQGESRYFDLFQTRSFRADVLAKRESDEAAEEAAWDIQDVLAHADLSSSDGSYELSGFEVSTPRPVSVKPDETGYYTWHLQVTLHE